MGTQTKFENRTLYISYKEDIEKKILKSGKNGVKYTKID